MADICRFSICLIEWQEGSTSLERLFQDLFVHFSHLSTFGIWPVSLAFEEYKWRSEFFYLASEFFRLIGKESIQGKFFSMKMFENYVRNRQLQISKFEDIDSQRTTDSFNPFRVIYEDESSGTTAKVDRNTTYYGCVNGRYPIQETGISMIKSNEDNMESRIEMEKFSKVKSKTLKEIEEAISSSQNIESLKNTVLALKLMRRNIFKVESSAFKYQDLTTIWPWEEMYLSSRR